MPRHRREKLDPTDCLAFNSRFIEEREKTVFRNRRSRDHELSGGAALRAVGDHEIRKNKQLAIECCLFFRIS